MFIGRIKKRGYFWKAKDGRKLTLKEFFSQWGKGITECTPLQMTKVSLWSFLPLFSGILWGITITFIAKTYWMTLILCGSLPLTIIQFISTIQKYIVIKKVDAEMAKLNEQLEEEEVEVSCEGEEKKGMGDLGTEMGEYVEEEE